MSVATLNAAIKVNGTIVDSCGVGVSVNEINTAGLDFPVSFTTLTTCVKQLNAGDEVTAYIYFSIGTGTWTANCTLAKLTAIKQADL